MMLCLCALLMAAPAMAKEKQGGTPMDKDAMMEPGGAHEDQEGRHVDHTGQVVLRPAGGGDEFASENGTN